MSFSPPSSTTPPEAFHPQPLQAIACPACFGAVAVGADLLGRAAECPLCGAGFRVPSAGAGVPPPRPSALADPASSKPHRRSPKRERKAPPAAPPERPEPTAERKAFPYDPPSAPEPEPAPPPEHAADEPPAEPAPAAEMQFQEPVPTIGSGDRVITLHRLTPKEKAARRARRNIVMLLTGVSILMAIVLLLGTKRPKRHD